MQNNPPNKKPIYQQWWCWVLAAEAVVIIGLAIGLVTSLMSSDNSTQVTSGRLSGGSTGGSSTGTTNTGTGNNSSTGTGNQAETPAKHYKVGEKIKNDEYTLVITDFVRDLDPELTYKEIASGQELVKVGVEITNNLKKSNFITSSDFDLFDTDDNQYNEASAYKADDIWHDGDLMPGESKSGYIYYIVPKAQDFTLLYDPFGSNNENYVDLN